MCLSINIYLTFWANITMKFTHLKILIVFDVLFICCNLSELNSKQAEYWLRALQTAYSLSFSS